MKKVLVTGSSGYVANFIMLKLSLRCPELAIIGMSRSGKARNPEVMGMYKNIEYVQGNCLQPETFKDVL